MIRIFSIRKVVVSSILVIFEGMVYCFNNVLVVKFVIFFCFGVCKFGVIREKILIFILKYMEYDYFF